MQYVVTGAIFTSSNARVVLDEGTCGFINETVAVGTFPTLNLISAPGALASRREPLGPAKFLFELVLVYKPLPVPKLNRLQFLFIDPETHFFTYFSSACCKDHFHPQR